MHWLPNCRVKCELLTVAQVSQHAIFEPARAAHAPEALTRLNPRAAHAPEALTRQPSSCCITPCLLYSSLLRQRRLQLHHIARNSSNALIGDHFGGHIRSLDLCTTRSAIAAIAASSASSTLELQRALQRQRRIAAVCVATRAVVRRGAACHSEPRLRFGLRRMLHKLPTVAAAAICTAAITPERSTTTCATFSGR